MAAADVGRVKLSSASAAAVPLPAVSTAGKLACKCTTTITWRVCLAPPLLAAQVVVHAVAYMRMRCLASPAILMYYVLSGTFRGFKDTKRVADGEWEMAGIACSRGWRGIALQVGG